MADLEPLLDSPNTALPSAAIIAAVMGSHLTVPSRESPRSDSRGTPPYQFGTPEHFGIRFASLDVARHPGISISLGFVATSK